MACRIGMATNVPERVGQLKTSGSVPQNATYRTLDSGLTYSEATQKEVNRRNACGRHCQGQAGGGYVAGRVWNVYRVDW